ncbi:hypothetical protein BJ741DRAFT_610517 [Chytriomyces cf. hyalinus JEL632]|nr:hypothetical protein BJ741DRAFT_610517 [Chytriomyces cf. hyalinus JEL632]
MSLGERIGTAKPKGLSKRVIDALPIKTFNGDISAEISSKGKAAVDTSTKETDQDAKCSICLTEFEAGESICGLPCLHWFHGGCVRTWLGTSKVCPM